MKWLRATAVTLVLVIGFGSVFFYVIAAGLVNAQPQTQPFDGWVAALQMRDETGPEQVVLSVRPAGTDVAGDRPFLEYSLLICGSQPFHGVLLLGGQARLDQPLLTSSPDQAAAKFVELESGSLTGSQEKIDLGSVQIAEVNIAPATPCVSELGSKDFVGSGYSVSGRVRAPIQRPATYMGLETGRHSQVWPRVGGLPGVADAHRGFFEGDGPLRGSWLIPRRLSSKVTVGPLLPRAVVDVAVPPLSNASSIAWDQTSPIAATVRITNVDAMAGRQDLLAVAGIALGLGGSLLASMLFEVVKTRFGVAVPSPATGSVPGQERLPRAAVSGLPNSARSPRWGVFAALLGSLLIIRELCRRFGKR
ncbi:hypothetical protein SK803_40820 [Lentzea sp. BCCO 10_0856]|uniref:Uncharacterized protein n=1 Tax=Lentzea miocenica TaxID=3095431 RepID=A0ABU4TEF5_9PSEU|nr:hypothetical protein [Lentzea sp. BCCO 10_0856]MDX8036575.1 hypothetical protein [Lentzea sp. BCCO 10_0856]